MNKEWIQLLGNLLFVCELECALEGDPVRRSTSANHELYPGNLPDTLEMHWPYLDDMAGLLAFQDTISAAPSHTGHIQQLGSVDHVIICLN